ncbi:50S ribosomal protein L24 [Candidatus Bipolaricaulota bacterium]|nr:50S ribosomal protein L24 [Candidatus Bipolaricaulota bacterium]HBR10529.1 50S ribosomal protein L24 [Candidatus Acetothermia bacterium]
MRKVKKGDRVRVIAGNDQGKEGKVLTIYPNEDRIIVDNINIITKHQRATQTMREPGIVKRPGKIHISNVLVICPECNVSTRIGFVFEEGEKMRKCKQCGEIFK